MSFLLDNHSIMLFYKDTNIINVLLVGVGAHYNKKFISKIGKVFEV